MNNFICPQCDGIHFNSSQDGPSPSSRTYRCKGTAHGPQGTGLGIPFQKSCEWSGRKEYCFVDDATFNAHLAKLKEKEPAS